MRGLMDVEIFLPFPHRPGNNFSSTNSNEEQEYKNDKEPRNQVPRKVWMDSRFNVLILSVLQNYVLYPLTKSVKVRKILHHMEGRHVERLWSRTINATPKASHVDVDQNIKTRSQVFPYME